jgi:hypothetical protein
MLSDLIGKVAGDAFRRQGFAQLEIVARWPAIVGDVMARFSAPERISFPLGDQSGGTLYIRTDGAFALELQHLEPIVIERINSYYGFPAVARLAIRQGPLPRREVRKPFRARPLSAAELAELAQSLQPTTDEKLKEALEKLGLAVLGDGPAIKQKTVSSNPKPLSQNNL